MVSSKYAFLAHSDLHRPCLEISRSATPLAAVCGVPPDLRLWGVNRDPSEVIGCMKALNCSYAVVYEMPEVL